MPALQLSTMTAVVGNTLWNLDGEFQFDFNVTPNSVLEVLQNVFEIWATPLGSQVLLETFGQDVSWIGAPGNIGQFQMQTAFLLACSYWEPRATFKHISFGLTAIDTMAGKYYLNVELEIDFSKAAQVALFGAPAPVNTWIVDNTQAGNVPIVQQSAVTL
jgi:phage baseplate assembly protein W